MRAPTKSFVVTVLAMLILCLAIALRLNGMWSGLPYQLNPDEPVLWLNGVGWATKFGPHFSGWLAFYPPLRSWELALEYIGLDLVTPGAPAQFVYFVAGRYAAALFVCVLAALTFQAGKLVAGEWAGLLAMLYIVTDPFSVAMGRSLKSETLTWMFSMATVVLSLMAYRSQRNWFKLLGLAFVAGALAALAKYNFVLVMMAPCLVVYLRTLKSVRLRVAGFVLVVFLLGLFFWILDHPGFLDPFLSSSYFNLFSEGKEGSVLTFPSLASIVSQWWETLRPWNALVALGALPAALVFKRFSRQEWWAWVLVLAIAGVTIFFMGLFWRARPQDIYLLYLVSALVWGMGVSLIGLKSRLAALLVGVLMLLPWIVDDIRSGFAAQRPDTRVITAEWFIDNVPEGTHLAVEYDAVEFERAYGGFPSEKVFFVELITSVHEEPVESFARRGIEYLVADFRNINRGGFFDSVGDDEAFLARVETLVDLDHSQSRGWRGPARYIFHIPALQQVPMHVFLGDSIIFKGYDLPQASVSPGDTLELVLYWAALQETDANYTVFAHLLDSDGVLVAQNDGLPGDALHRTYDWWAGYFDWDEWPLLIPPEAPPGEYTLIIGMYDADTLVRLPAVGADGAPLGDHIMLTTLTIAR